MVSAYAGKMNTLGIVLTIALLGGCASRQVSSGYSSAAPEFGFEHSIANDVNTIAILTPGFSQSVSVTEGTGHNPGTILPLPSGGGSSISSAGAGVIIAGAAAAIALGAVVADEAVEASRERRLNALIEQRGFSPQEYLWQRLEKEIQEQGYAITLVPTPRENADFIEAHALESLQTSTNVDAFLDVVVEEYGYWANALDNGRWIYRPKMVAKVQLIDARDLSLLMRRSLVYMPGGADMASRVPRVGPILLEPEETFQFVDFDTLEPNADLALAGLREAFAQPAGAIGRELARQEYPGRFYVASPEQDRIAKLFAPVEGNCQIYVAYQSERGLLESGMEALGGEPRWLYEDGEAISFAHPGYFSVVALAPGTHKLAIVPDTTYANPVVWKEFDCRDGELQFLQVEHKRQGTLRQFGYSLSVLDADQGRQTILRSKFLRVPEEIQMTDGRPVFRFQN